MGMIRNCLALTLVFCTMHVAQAQTVSEPVATTPTAVVGKTYSCRVHKVWDGDTFDALCVNAGEIRVRLYQADAPERNQPRGGEALRWLNQRVWKQNVRVRVIALEGATENRQSRLVAIVTHNRKNVNLALVRDGWAWAAPGFTKPGDGIRRAEKTARGQKVGLWQDPNPIAPWAWRHGKRAAQ
jgi:micrococcal nuclease